MDACQAEPFVVGDGSATINRVQLVLDSACAEPNPSRPCLTLTYAQSLDGCISADPQTSTPISNHASQVMTHRLRAAHDAILVGINTVLVDDPQLNVRYANGSNPTPVIVDSRLRTPTECRLLQRPDIAPMIATTEQASSGREAELIGAGALVKRLPATADGHVDLDLLFEYLREVDIRSVMIEGGAKIITSMLKRQLADQLVLAISPLILGGVRAVESLCDVALDARPRLRNVHFESVEGEIVIQGEFTRDKQ